MIRLITALCLAVCLYVDDNEPIHHCLNSLELGTAVEYQNLKIFPLYAKRALSVQNYYTLDEAMDKGWLTIREIGSGDVNSVEIKNNSEHMVFIMTGEIISGAKQDRMLSEDLLLPRKSGWVRASVYCVEHGRWTHVSPEFASEKLLAPNAVRKRAKITESQTDVWDEIAAGQQRLGVASATQTVRANYEDKKVQAEIDQYVREFERVPTLSHKAIGVVVISGNRIICCDIFANNTLFSKLWKKLLKSYAMDALGGDKVTIRNDAIKDFLESLKNAQYVSAGTPGAGRLMNIESDFGKGAALVYKTAVVHMDFFPFNGALNDDAGMRLDIRRDSRR